MLHAIVVDDESSALRWFEKIALESRSLHLEKAFRSAQEAVGFFRGHKMKITSDIYEDIPR